MFSLTTNLSHLCHDVKRNNEWRTAVITDLHSQFYHNYTHQMAARVTHSVFHIHNTTMLLLYVEQIRLGIYYRHILLKGVIIDLL